MQLRTTYLASALLVLATGCGPSKLAAGTDGGPNSGSGFNCIDNDGDGVPGTGNCDGVSVVDCDDADPAVRPGAAEVCNGKDDDCNAQVDEGLELLTSYRDLDGDGYGGTEVTGTGCGPAAAGSANKGGDCNDSDPAVHPGATEVCNGVDDDCSGAKDDGVQFQDFYPDADGDGFGDGAATAQNSCLATVAGKVPNGKDCADQDPTIKPGAPEACNGKDDNCDGQIDNGVTHEDYYPDRDGDGYGDNASVPESRCSPAAGKVKDHTDCNDGNPAVHPGATELCNGIDDNCNTQQDEGLAYVEYYPDSDGDTFGSNAAVAQLSCQPVPGKVTNNLDCDDTLATVRPGATETCNARDDNCDGQVDEGLASTHYYPDLDGDGHGAAGSLAQSSCAPVPGKVTSNDDCNDANSGVHPAASETCNGIDDNCNAQADEGQAFFNYYPDLDADGYGAANAVAQSACKPVAGKVTNNGDCNDTDTNINPGIAEQCNGIDDNCNGQTDEGSTFANYYPDSDSDGYGSTSGAPVSSCKPVPGKVTNNTDCNDGVASIHPGATEACNNLDDDCDGQIDENASGGGASCQTGQAGVCAAGSINCQGGALTCLRLVNPGAELCDGLDNDCNNSIDETFLNKGLACSAGVGACQRSGVYACKTDKTGTRCSVDAGTPTLAACDGIDNDCDGVIDEPFVSATANLTTTTAWTDIEVAPYYYSSGSCAGGVNGSGTDWLSGGALVMGGSAGIAFQRLDSSGAPVGSPTSPSTFSYSEVAIAQSGDGYLIAGIWTHGPEIDFYYVDSQGANRTYLYSQFQAGAGNSIDSLRLVRANGRRVAVVWREVITGASPATRLRLARVETGWNGSTGTLRNAGGGLPPISSSALSVAATVSAGVGADSSHLDGTSSQSCSSASALRKLGLAYLAGPTSLRYFTVNEDGSGKSTDTVVATESGTRTLSEPEIAYFQSSSADQWFVGYVTRDTGAPPQADLDYWLTTSPSWHYAWLQYATDNGAPSILRPRATITGSRIWLSALRYVPDSSGFKRQIMTRTIDFFGNKDPDTSVVELPVTQGGCGADPACRPGDKDGAANWAAKGRLFYSASGSSPGAFVSSLTCQ